MSEMFISHTKTSTAEFHSGSDQNHTNFPVIRVQNCCQLNCSWCEEVFRILWRSELCLEFTKRIQHLRRLSLILPFKIHQLMNSQSNHRLLKTISHHTNLIKRIKSISFCWNLFYNTLTVTQWTCQPNQLNEIRMSLTVIGTEIMQTICNCWFTLKCYVHIQPQQFYSNLQRVHSQIKSKFEINISDLFCISNPKKISWIKSVNFVLRSISVCLIHKIWKGNKVLNKAILI